MLLLMLTMYSIFFPSLLIGAIAVPFNWHSDTNSFAFVGGLNCTGNELHILNCPFNSTVSSCPSNNDANVICPSKKCL